MADRYLTDTSTISWDEATSGQVKANIVAGSITDTHINSISQSKITNLVSDLAAKAPLSSPTFTGNPVAPTQSAGDNSTKLSTTAFVATAIANAFAANDALVYKGAIDCSSNPNYPAADAGHTYRISVAGKIGGASGVNVEAGDMIICHTDSSSSGNHATVGANWDIIQLNIDGAVTSASSVGDNGLSVFYQKNGSDLEFRKIDVISPLGIDYTELPNKDIIISLSLEDLDNNARVGVRKNGAGSTYERRRLNFIEGSNVTISISDDGTDEEVEITIAAAGGGGGGGATTALDNLASVAINTSLVSDTDNIDDVGSASIRWKEGHFAKLLASTFQSPGALTVNAQGANTLFSGDLAGGGYSTLMSFQGGILTLQGKVQIKSGYGTLSGDGRLEALAASDSEHAFVANSAASPTVDVAQFRVNGTKKVAVNKRGNLVAAQYTPSSASDTGETGEIAVDGNYIYVCTGTDTWKRVAIATW